MVADDPDQKIDLKAFHNRIVNDHKAIAAESAAYKPIPAVRQINNQVIKKVFEQIKDDVCEIIETEYCNDQSIPSAQTLACCKEEVAKGVFEKNQFSRDLSIPHLVWESPIGYRNYCSFKLY